MKQSLLWSTLGGLFMLFVGYVVWQQNQQSAVLERCASLEKHVVETNLETKRWSERSINALRTEMSEKVYSIDKKQDVEFAKINTQLQSITQKLVEIQADLVKIKRQN